MINSKKISNKSYKNERKDLWWGTKRAQHQIVFVSIQNRVIKNTLTSRRITINNYKNI